MNQKKFVILISIYLTLLLSSCMTTTMKLSGVQHFLPLETSLIVPEIGKINSIYIGDYILKEKTMFTYDVIILNREFGVSGLSSYHPSGKYRFDTFSTEYNIYHGLYQQLNGFETIYPRLLEDKQGSLFRETSTGKMIIPKNEYRKDKEIVIDDNKFEQNLIYTGTDGLIAKFSYREFSNGLARPAFTVDVTYDLSKEKIIRFKRASFEIVSFDNQSITYKVLSGFRNN